MEFEPFQIVCPDVSSLTRWFGLDVTLAELSVLEQAHQGRAAHILPAASVNSSVIDQCYRPVLDQNGDAKVLGKGEFGEVSLWLRKEDPTPAALKAHQTRDPPPPAKAPLSPASSSRSASLLSRLFFRRSSSSTNTSSNHSSKSDLSSTTSALDSARSSSDRAERKTMVAVKKLSKGRLVSDRRSAKQRLRFLQCVQNEVLVLKEMAQKKSALGGEYVTGLVDVFEDEHSVSLVTPYYGGGDLFNHLVHGPLDEIEAMKLTWQLVQAVYFIHEECRAMHCDLKPENVMFEDESHEKVRVIDFGMARVVDYRRSYSDACGSAYYTAPEVINTPTRRAAYSRPCDIWALGSLVFVILYGFPCFAVNSAAYKSPSQIRRAIYRKILEGFVPRVFEASEVGYGPWFPDTIPASDLARDFIGRCLVSDPSLRSTARELLCHPWFASMRCEPQMLAVESELFGKVVSSTLVRWFPKPDCILTRENAAQQYIVRALLCYQHREWDYRQLVGWLFMREVLHSSPVLFDFLHYLAELMTTVPISLKSQRASKDEATAVAIAKGARVTRKQFNSVLKRLSAGMSKSVCKVVWSEVSSLSIFGETAALIVGDLVKLMSAVSDGDHTRSDDTSTVSPSTMTKKSLSGGTTSDEGDFMGDDPATEIGVSIEESISFESLAMVLVIDYLTRNKAAKQIAFHSLCQLSDYVRQNLAEPSQESCESTEDTSGLVHGSSAEMIDPAQPGCLKVESTESPCATVSESDEHEKEESRVSRMSRGLSAAVAVAAAAAGITASPLSSKKKVKGSRRRRSGSVSLSQPCSLVYTSGSRDDSERKCESMTFDLNALRDYILDNSERKECVFEESDYSIRMDGLVSPTTKCLMTENRISNAELVEIMFDVIRGRRMTEEDYDDPKLEDLEIEEVKPHSPSIQDQCCTSSFHYSSQRADLSPLSPSKMRVDANRVSYAEFLTWFQHHRQ